MAQHNVDLLLQGSSFKEHGWGKWLVVLMVGFEDQECFFEVRFLRSCFVVG